MVRWKIRNFSPVFQSPALVLLWLCPCPQPEDSVGLRGCAQPESTFSFHLDQVLHPQDPGISYLNSTDCSPTCTCSLGSSSWWTQGWLFAGEVWTRSTVHSRISTCMLERPLWCEMNPGVGKEGRWAAGASSSQRHHILAWNFEFRNSQFILAIQNVMIIYFSR